MSSQRKSDFAVLCRTHRVRLGLKQRQVAERIGIQASTYGNVESSPFKVIREERVKLLVDTFRLIGTDAVEFVAASERCPLSEFGQRRREMWTKRNRLRSKAKNHDRLQISIIELFSLLFMSTPENATLCNCAFGGGTVDDPSRSCEVCEALEGLGILEGWTTRAQVEARLDKLYDELKPIVTRR